LPSPFTSSAPRCGRHDRSKREGRMARGPPRAGDAARMQSDLTALRESAREKIPQGPTIRNTISKALYGQALAEGGILVVSLSSSVRTGRERNSLSDVGGRVAWCERMPKRRNLSVSLPRSLRVVRAGHGADEKDSTRAGEGRHGAVEEVDAEGGQRPR